MQSEAEVCYEGATVRIPLIEDLTTGPIPAGSDLLVEFDPASQWYNASLTIAAGWIKGGGMVSYSSTTQPPDSIRLKLNRLGVNAEALEREKKLEIWDWYTATLGQISKEKLAVNSLFVSDLSIFYSTGQMGGPPIPEWLMMIDDGSVLARFNEEKSWVEFSLTRTYPLARLRKSTIIGGLLRGVHSDWVYNRLEAAADGIIDFRVDETVDPIQNLIRIRSMRDIGFDGRWHRIKVGENLEVTLESD